MIAAIALLALGPSPPDVATVEAALRAQMAEANASGTAFAIVLDGRIAATRGLGVRAKGGADPVTPDTLFMIGSVTKTLTTAAVLRAAEAGTLELDAPIARVLLGLDPAVAALTPRQLVSQTSGLGDLPGVMGTSDDDALIRFARSLGPKQFVAPPGAVFSYSNPGLALAGAALEAARKQPYADAMRALLFRPLGMARTTLRAAEAATHARAVGHDPKGDPVSSYDVDTRLGPSGYAYSSAKDLAVFLREWLAAYEGHGRVVSRQATRLMATRVTDFPATFDGTGYGHGLFVEDRRQALVVHHGGQMTGFSAQIVLVPERRLGLVLLMNRERVLFTKTVDAALQSLAGLAPVTVAPLDEGAAVSQDEARPLLGRYLNRWPLELVWADGGLRLKWGDGVREVRRLSPDRYVARAASLSAVELRTGRSADGQPYLRQFLWAFGRDFVPGADNTR